MSNEMDSMSGVLIYLLVFFAVLPVVFFVLSRAASTAFDPESEQIQEIRRLADQLDEQIRKILQAATHEFRSAAGQRQVLDLIIQLAEAAERFKLKMTVPSQSPGIAQREFFLLQTAFQNLYKDFPRLQSYPLSAALVIQLVRTMESLRFYFDSPPGEELLGKETPSREKSRAIAPPAGPELH